MATAWVLNLDADLELGAAGPYTPTKSVRAAMSAMIARAASLLLGPDDRLVDEASAAGSARGLRGRAWCPTPRAIALLERVGADVEAHPPLEVLRRVNARSFTAALGVTLPKAAFVNDRATAFAMLTGTTTWRVKREHGMAGRGHRVIDAARRSAADDAFVLAGIAEGGVQIEPNVPIVAEYGKHGMIGKGEPLRIGTIVRQRCDARGVWIESEAIAAPTQHERDIDECLARQAKVAADALVAAGYFGPFGIDAFTYRGADGEVHLHPLSEINARYSMGFGLGLAP